MHILIAEDDLTSRKILTSILQKQGHEIEETKDGLEALAAMRRPGAAKLAILDWMMPGLDGVAVCKALRETDLDQQPYLILLTTRSEKADIVSGLEAGADDYLPKPYDAEELKARVNVGRRILQLQTTVIEARNALAYEATHDSLTGILNRRAISNALSCELSRADRTNESVAVGLCDLDSFKSVNDSLGHLAGDEVICGVVGQFKRNLRLYDHIGRWGGEEFLIVAPGCTLQDAVNLFDRLRAAVEKSPIMTSAGRQPMTVSIGVTCAVAGISIDDLVAAADAALYRAKRAGRNRVQVEYGTAVVEGPGK